MTVKNESPDGGPLAPRPRAPSSVSPDGSRLPHHEAVVVKPASKQVAADGTTTVTASETEVWVEAVEKGNGVGAQAADPVHDRRVHRRDSDDVYGFATC